MSRFIYTAWFLDAEAGKDDPDREWVACIIIEAACENEAQRWGDTLARARADRTSSETLLRSSVEPEDDSIGSSDGSILPRIKAGETAADEVIGW